MSMDTDIKHADLSVENIKAEYCKVVYYGCKL